MLGRVNRVWEEAWVYATSLACCAFICVGLQAILSSPLKCNCRACCQSNGVRSLRVQVEAILSSPLNCNSSALEPARVLMHVLVCGIEANHDCLCLFILRGWGAARGERYIRNICLSLLMTSFPINKGENREAIRTALESLHGSEGVRPGADKEAAQQAETGAVTEPAQQAETRCQAHEMEEGESREVCVEDEDVVAEDMDSRIAKLRELDSTLTDQVTVLSRVACPAYPF
jgi:hypothetical protein